MMSTLDLTPPQGGCDDRVMVNLTWIQIGGGYRFFHDRQPWWENGGFFHFPTKDEHPTFQKIFSLFSQKTF